MKDTTLKKIVMWHEVNALFPKLNKTQIGKLLGIHRDTVRSYLSMSREEFESSDICNRKYKKKLAPYEEFIHSKLDEISFLSSSQIHDLLKENFPDFIEVSERTVYSYVEYIRATYNIPKKEEKLPRQMHQLPPQLTENLLKLILESDLFLIKTPNIFEYISLLWCYVVPDKNLSTFKQLPLQVKALFMLTL